MNQYPKCKHCKHSKTKHKVLSIRPTVTKVWPVCLDCSNFQQNGPTYEWEYDINAADVVVYHTYHPDNLSFIEKLAERRGLV